MSVARPHWDLPPRLINGRMAVVEQDSPAEIANCVEVAARTRLGSRVEAPEFGMPPVVMRAGDVDVDTLRAALVESELRARPVASLINDPADLRSQHVRILLEEGT